MRKLLAIVSFTAYVIHFRFLVINLVDLPKLDDWIMINPEIARQFPSLNWIWSDYCDHRYVLYRLFSWALYHVGIRNLIFTQIFSFLVFGILLLLFALIMKRLLSPASFWKAAWFFPFLLFPLLLETHFWSLLVSVHWSYLFFFISGFFLFREDRKKSGNGKWYALVFLFLSIISDSNGVPLSWGLTTTFLFWRFLHAGWKISLREGWVLFLPSLIFFVAVKHNPSAIPRSYPFHNYFWDYFLAQCSIVFGFVSPVYWKRFICFALIFIPPTWILATRARNLKKQEWFWIGSEFGIVLCLLAVVVSRAHDWKGRVGVADLPLRYREFSIYLLPLVAYSWVSLFEKNRKLSNFVALSLWLLTLKGYWRHISFESYFECREGREITKACIDTEIRNGNRPICPEFSDRYLMQIYTTDFTERVKIAYDLGFDFSKGWGEVKKLK